MVHGLSTDPAIQDLSHMLPLLQNPDMPTGQAHMNATAGSQDTYSARECGSLTSGDPCCLPDLMQLPWNITDATCSARNGWVVPQGYMGGMLRNANCAAKYSCSQVSNPCAAYTAGSELCQSATGCSYSLEVNAMVSKQSDYCWAFCLPVTCQPSHTMLHGNAVRILHAYRALLLIPLSLLPMSEQIRSAS